MESKAPRPARVRQRIAVWIVAGLLRLAFFPGHLLAAEAPPMQALAVFAGGTSRLISLPATGELGLPPGVSHWWIWSGQSLPRRVDGPDPRVVPAVAPFTTLVARSPTAADGSPAAGDLVVAPVEMWEEVPENLLPRWSTLGVVATALERSGDAPMRLRWIGSATSSEWIEVGAVQGSTLELRTSPSSSIEAQIRGSDGPLQGPAELAVVREVAGIDRVLAFWRSDGQGRISTSSIPPGPLTFRASGPAAVERYFFLKTARFPRRILLEPGCTLALRVVDGQGRPISKARAVARVFASELSSSISERAAESDGSGRLELAALRRAQASLDLGGKGLATRRETIDLAACRGRFDLGRRELVAGRDLALTIVDDLGRPVPGAEVRGSAGQSAKSDKTGRVELKALVATAPEPVRVTVEAHVALETSIAPGKTAERLVLIRQSGVRGRFLDARDAAPSEPAVNIFEGRRFRPGRVGSDGRFLIYLDPRSAVELEFSSSNTRSIRKSVTLGLPGEIVDLGIVRADSGVAVRGKILSELSGEPVAGARLLCPKSSAPTAVVAWVNGDLLQAISRPDGSFLLSGLENRPTRLRVQATGFSPLEVDVVPDAGLDELDLGDLWLNRGITVRVTSEVEDGVARVDPRSEWNEVDMLQAQLLDGEASIDNVPPGRAIVSVIEAGKLRCDRTVEIPAESENFTVDCPVSHILVQGMVTAGGGSVGAGLLSWQAPRAGDAGSMILKSGDPSGLSRESVYGAGRPQVDVAVAADGHYETRELSAGAWSVVWFPADGGASPPLRTTVPEATEVNLPLDFSTGTVVGLVVDTEGAPVARARVRHVEGSALTLTDAEGRFAIVGLPNGRVGIQATEGDRRSAVVGVELGTGTPSEPLQLELGEDGGDEIALTTHLQDGRPVSALVAFETQGQPTRILTTRSDGTLAVPVAGLDDTLVRAAALVNGSWALGVWQRLDAARVNGIELNESPGATLVLRAGERRGNLDLQSASGWSMTLLYRLMGVRMVLDGVNPAVVVGLPPGEYRVTFEGKIHTVSVDRPEYLDIDLSATD